MGEMNSRAGNVAFLLAILLACAQTVTRDRWEQMSPSARTLYVSSLLGGEKAKSAKGGSVHIFSKRAEDYVRLIDDAYARGDRRDPAVIFASLADRQ
jgi:hypothetical protein